MLPGHSTAIEANPEAGIFFFADEQLEFMQDKCAQAAELLGLHIKSSRCSPEST